MIRALALLFCLSTGTTATAQTDPAAAAEAAAARLENAAIMLSEATTGRARVDALTETVRAYEDGLVALRDGLRRAAIRERAIRLEFEARRDEVSRLVGVLTTMSAAPTPLLLLHPSGPIGTARSGMILSEITPALQAEAEELRTRLEELSVLSNLQQDAAATLEAGMRGVQDSRTALSQAISERTDLPRRFVEDRVGMATLVAATDTLAGFADGLSVSIAAEGDAPAPDARARRGSLPAPVQGTLIRRYGEADAAGTVRPGWILATRPRALVTAPAAATIRYAGPLLDLGNVSIIEPAPDVLIVLAGLGEVYGNPGEVVPEGAPLGLMPGETPNAQAILTEAAQGMDAPRSETLYVEVRDGQDTADPGDWFAPLSGRTE
ncbi:murein hydrolase activator EnvC family protein [Roseisalinus antarcticus]|uniref:Peptidase family M23 n=1 Tax=Roseisalinus antarcticus TaxID=254357 RepID=A0A1Y5T8Q0_9RHOB|nr:peptidase M23 [Roseisalinus antarcticus]SLN58223.1 hypothetical protein ROA7023_02661 [Roseisalinus antarcticus]